MSNKKQSLWLRSAIKRIALQTRRLAVSSLTGAFCSVFKGKGMEFDEVREYQYDDEPRDIDWNVSARMGKLFVKKFREEREITLLLAVDISASTHFGSVGYSKAATMAEVAATLAFSAITNHDKVGLLLFSDKIEKYIPPKNGSRHVLRIIRELLSWRGVSAKTEISKALSYLRKVQPRRAVCFLLSDFISPCNYGKEALLAAKLYDTIAIRVTDPAEQYFPSVGIAQLKDLETGELVLVDTSQEAVREHFYSEIKEEREAHTQLLRHSNIELVEIFTDKPYLVKLQNFFYSRLHRR